MNRVPVILRRYPLSLIFLHPEKLFVNREGGTFAVYDPLAEHRLKFLFAG